MAVLSLVCLYACTPSANTGKSDIFQYKGEEHYNIAYGGFTTVQFRTNLEWHLECSLPESKISFSRVSGKAENNVMTYKIEVKAGPDGYTGEAEFTLVATGNEKHTQKVNLTFLTEDVVQSTLRIMQFNILQATSETAGHEWATVRKEPCIKMLTDISPDIVCCEEARKTQCNNLATAFPGYSQIKHPKDDIESNGGQRNLIMYKTDKYEQLEWNKYWFSVDGTAKGDRFGDSKTTQKLTIYAKMKEIATGKIFWVYCTHFFADCEFQATRSKCVEMSLNSIKSVVPADGTVFFLGDLNINYADDTGKNLLSPLLDYMKSAACEAETGASSIATTYNKWGNSNKVLDYILYRNAHPLSYNIISDGTSYGTKYLSDHNPIWSDFTF